MAFPSSELAPAAGLSGANEEELRLLLEQLGTPQGFAVSLAWVPDEATARAVIEALRSRLPQPPKVIDARAWPKDQPFLRWLLEQAGDDCADGRVCIVAGLGGVEMARHPLRHLNTNRNHWMCAAPCHWVLMLPPYAQLRATAEAAGLPRFALGEEMPDVYSIRAGDYVFEVEPGLAQSSMGRADVDRWGRRFKQDEVEKALEFLRQLDPGKGPDGAVLYARALVNELEPFVEGRSLAATPSARELLMRAQPDKLPPGLRGRVLALSAVLAQQWRDPEGAMRLTEEALDGLEAALTPKEIGSGTLADIIAGLLTLACLELKGISTRLCSALTQAIAACERTYGPDHFAVGAILNGLAGLLFSQGKHAEAEPLARRALAIGERVLGPDDPDVAKTINNLAILLSSQAKYAEAEPLARRGLAIREQALGPEHPDVAGSLNSLAIALEGQGKDTEAEPLYRRAVAIAEATLGREHPEARRYRHNLARLWLRT